MVYVLWVLQVLIGLFFALASGVPKLVLPVETLPLPLPIPEVLLRLIGVAEVLGGLGLILPGLLRIKPWLTPLAAAGLVVIMIGATALTMAADGVAAGVVPLAIGLLAVFVAYGRWRLAPHPARREMIRRRSS